jgi:hypothetical protein
LINVQKGIDKDIEDFFNGLVKWNLNSQYMTGKLMGFIPKVTFPLFRYDPYPEITGYGISLFSKLYKLYRNEEYFRRALLGSEAIMKLQLPSGCFKYSLRKNSREMLFDSLMIVNGLFDFYEISNEEKLLRAIFTALEKLLKLLEHFHTNDINAPYFHIAKGAIPLIKAYLNLGDAKFLRAAEKLCCFTISNFQNKDGGFRLQFDVPEWNRFHYLCYAIEGLIALESQNPTFFENIRRGAVYLLNNQRIDGGLWYSFTKRGVPIKNFVDNAATAQAIRIFLFIFSRTHEKGFITASVKALNYLLKQQHKTLGLIRGGLSFGYHPLIDNMVACSWATQFATDAVISYLNLNNANDGKNVTISF